MYKSFGDAAQTLTVWDSDSSCTLKPELLVLWRQFTNLLDDHTTVSICEIVENNDLAIRAKLLRLISEVGDSVTGNRKTSHAFRDGFEYFWMTQFHSRPYTPSAQLNNLAKIMALVDLLQENKTRTLIVHSDDDLLLHVLSNVAITLQIELRVIRPKTSKQQTTLRSKIKRIAPRPLLAIFALCTQLKTSISLKSHQPKAVHPDSISFFDYWYRFTESVGVERRFGSQYWSKLVDYLEDANINWWHNLVDQHKFEELKTAKNLLADFNRHPKHHHAITDSNIDLRIILRTILDHLKLVLRSFPSKKYESAFKDPATGINFWPLFRQEWLNSLRGYEALLNCLRFNRLESLISQMPKQKLGFYLIENQPWEMALIYLWRRHNHGKLVGVAHSTIRFWDIRLMSDASKFKANSLMPRPDCIGVNGNLAKSTLLQSGYPPTEIVEVEALMYLHLTTSRVKPLRHSQTVVLVATDYLDSATRAQLHLLEELIGFAPGKFRFLLKSHWSQSFDNLKFDIEIVPGKKDLAYFFDQADVLYCSAVTSAVIDGVCAGLPVIQCLDPLSFNLSPLRKCPALQTVRTSTELAEALDQIDKYKPNIDPGELFDLDVKLPKWRNLLQA